MNTASAFLILLACSPDSSSCQEMRYSRIYGSVEECRENLPATLNRLSRPGQPAIGRCVSSGPAIDDMTTASIERALARRDRQAIVNVTRIENGRPVVTIYNVPVEDE
ncbi:MAG: hypothetical protein M9939_21435 [Mesorhizobium sp.]|nr:hypothetical protein [Mesorhizobium sp.]MCO5163697.1 hypothetical protein [Mesorhizobium sp.]